MEIKGMLNEDDLVGAVAAKKLVGKVDDEGRAALTHYWQSGGNEALSTVAKTYYKQACQILTANEGPSLPITQAVAKKALSRVPFLPPKPHAFTFIDLFAGIGGFRIAHQKLGGRCLFSSEWDAYSKQSYLANFGEVPFGDITKERVKAFIPDNFDVLCAGFPCQAFSIAGKKGGFDDTRGTLFFDVAEILRRHKPKAFFLENVKGLVRHDKGRTLSTILNVLRNDLGYFVPDPEVMNAKDFGVPQNRERIFIVGFRGDLGVDKFTYPKPYGKKVAIADILEEKEVAARFYLSTRYLEVLRDHKARHANKGNGFGYEIKPLDGTATAVVCGGMGRERNLIIDERLTDFTPQTHIKGEVNREYVRKMTPREWARLQGFPDEFKITVSNTQAYKQFGNSVAVPAIQATANALLNTLKEHGLL